jgi:hypothetical protein
MMGFGEVEDLVKKLGQKWFAHQEVSNRGGQQLALAIEQGAIKPVRPFQ